MNFIPVPPFLLQTGVNDSISKSKGDSGNLLVACDSAITEFVTLHKNDEEFIDKAMTKCKDLVSWLYLVSQDDASIAAAPTIGCGNKKVAMALQGIKYSCLSNAENVSIYAGFIGLQVKNSLKRPFEVLVASSSSMSDSIEELAQF